MAESAVLVTGGTGFLGSTLVRQLRAQGRSVHVLVRSQAGRAPQPGLSSYAGDLTDATSVNSAFEQAARAATRARQDLDVVHGAALISYRRRDRALSEQVNVEGTRTVLAAARAVGVRRFCHVSSVVTVGHVPNATTSLNEESNFNGHALGSAYVSTKRRAEELALAAPGLDLVVVNPGAVFGPSPAGSNTTEFLARIARGVLGPLAPPGSLSAVGVEDVATGICAALERGRRGRRYLLTAENLTHFDLLGRAAAVFGRSGPRWVAPLALWQGLVLGLRAVERCVPLERATAEALALLGVHFRFDATRARDELGFVPAPFDEVLERTAAWMRETARV